MDLKKRGLSGIITVLILIGITMASALIVWSVVNSLVNKDLDEAKSCAGNFDKIKIIDRYTCYDSDNDRLQFSISVGDIDVDSVLVGISEGGTTKSYTITNTAGIVSGLEPYPDDSGTTVKLPEKNGGLTYLTAGNSYTSLPDSIELVPVINKNQCGVSDSLYSIDDCSLFS